MRNGRGRTGKTGWLLLSVVRPLVERGAHGLRTASRSVPFAARAQVAQGRNVTMPPLPLRPAFVGWEQKKKQGQDGGDGALRERENGDRPTADPSQYQDGNG